MSDIQTNFRAGDMLGTSKPVVAKAPVKATPKVEAPVVVETPVVVEAPVVEETIVTEEAPVVEETQVDTKPTYTAPKAKNNFKPAANRPSKG
jgi:hypothetical protein